MCVGGGVDGWYRVMFVRCVCVRDGGVGVCSRDTLNSLLQRSLQERQS